MVVIGVQASMIDLPPVTPITEACIVRSAESFGLPLPLLSAVLYVENGTPGDISKNTNKSYDMGPMQINSWWIPHFEKKGISKNTILNNGCVNVLVGASILHEEIRATKDLSKGVAQYHSRTPHFQQRYIALINKALVRFQDGYSLTKLVKRINKD
jgi:hypothetical protein